MSTDIKPGQTWKDRDDNARLRVDAIYPTRVGFTWMTTGAATSEYVDEFLSRFVLDAPAPLDPSKVKAGDTAEVEVELYAGPKCTVAGEVRQVGASLWIGPVCITLATDEIAKITLTDHQPAPEPEPEWEDGQIGDALVHGASVRGFISNNGESFVFSVPGGGYHEAGYGSFEDFVPLAALAPAHAYGILTGFFEANPREPHESAEEYAIRALTPLGIEVPA